MKIGTHHYGFLVRLPRVRGEFNALCVLVDRLTKSTYFISIKDITSSDQLGQFYVRKIMRFHGMPKTILSNRDMRFFVAF